MEYFKNDESLKSVTLQPSDPITNLPGGGTVLGRLARTYNRIGGLLKQFNIKTDVDVNAALAVWFVESGGKEFVENKPILRVEVHKLWKYWGKDNKAVFDKHFQFGGHNGIDGKAWKKHKFRKLETDEWQKFHGDQTLEYEVFEFATSLSSREAACLSSSFGGSQVMGFNFESLGYASATDLYEAFKASERWHVCGFFDFCKSKGLLQAVKEKRWLDFATGYNGSGQAGDYDDLIAHAYEECKKLKDLAVSRIIVPAAALRRDYPADFDSFVMSMGLKYIKAYELLTKGNQHNNSESSAYGLNTDPPRELWPNIVNTAKVVDELRQRLNAPVVLISVYRSLAYNTAIAGAGGSQHMQFNAIDFVVRNHMSPQTWASVLKEMRTAGFFSGGIGTYSSFVHVDTRGTNATW